MFITHLSHDWIYNYAIDVCLPSLSSVSSLYEFVQPQKDDMSSPSSPPPPPVTITTTSPTTTTAPTHPREDGQDRSSQVENGDMNGSISHKLSSSSNFTRSMEEESELDRGDSKSWNPFQQRSKSYIFSRSKKVKTTATATQTGKSESKELAAGEFWTLPRGKKKSRKKDKVVDKTAVPVNLEQRKMSDSQLCFEDNGQYSEENPPPLPPRPQELPPIQKRHVGQQSKGNLNDEFPESSTSHGLETSTTGKLQNRSSSCGCLLDDGKDEPDQSSLDFTQENACPYEVPRALMTTTLSRESEGLDPVDKQDGGTCATAIGRTALHSSFRSDIVSHPGETIGLRSLLGGDRSGAAFLTQRDRPMRDHLLHPPTHHRTHKRGGSYDQSLQVIMNREATPPSDMPRPSFTSPYTQPSSQPLVISSTQATLHWPADTQGVTSPNSDYHHPVKNYKGHPDEKRRNSPISSTFLIKKVSDTPASPLVATNLHSRQSSLPDFFVTDHKPVPPDRFTEYRAHNTTSAGLDEMQLSGEYVGKFHPRAEPLTPNPPPVCRSRSGTSLEQISSSDLRQSMSKSSSEEREYAVIVHSVKDGDTKVDISDQQDSEWSVQGHKTSHRLSEDSLYEQIDEEMVKNIVGRRGVPLLSSSFPKPLFPHDFNPDQETVHQIQQWHLKFLHFYQHWLRGLDKIVENSISRQTIENGLTSDNSASEQHLSGNSLGQSSISPPLINPSIPVSLQSANPPISTFTDQPALQTKDPPKPPLSDPTTLSSVDPPKPPSSDPPKPPSSDPTAFSSTDPPKPPSSDPPKPPSSDPPKPPSSDPPSATLPTKRETTAVTVYVSLQNKPGVHKRTESHSTQPQCSSMERTSPVLLRKPARSESRTAIRLPRRDRMSVDSVLDGSVQDTYDRLSGYHPQVMNSAPNIPESLYSKKSSLV